MQYGVLEGRECGSCNVCCVALTIKDEALLKPQGIRCKNAQRDNSCAIYADRPDTCREFNCGWRLLKWVKLSLRPDQSDVLVRFRSTKAADGTQKMGIDVTLLSAAALKAEGLAETIAAAVQSETPVFLTIPGPPGFTSAQVRLNDALLGAVLTRDKPAILAVLRQARRQGSKGPRTRINMDAVRPS